MKFLLEDALYDFQKYPGLTTSKSDEKVVEADDENSCALKCLQETSFACRSINVCKQGNGNIKCLLSNSHANNPDKSPELVENPSCTHYSSMKFEFN